MIERALRSGYFHAKIKLALSQSKSCLLKISPQTTPFVV
ncbi:hypothetical protein NC652_002291 [Populus alba x Populus x berolinensis]|nr:hypothetical protein NC652_002291 [Populus alba x Populus x berolinensis]